MMVVKCACSKAGSTKVLSNPSRTKPNGLDLVPIEEEPKIGETPQETLQSWLTPNPLFYVRNHYATPTVDESRWSLSIDGLVSNQSTLSLSEIQNFPKQTLPVLMECAGNNRSDLNPRVPGNPFQNGAISNAVWAGTTMRHVLERAGVLDGAHEVLFEGVDAGVPAPGATHAPYLRSLPLEVAMHPHTLLAYEMNGEPLSVEHGRPVRLIVPGWYGMASVKWLSKITVLDYKFEGFFQTDRYIVEEDNGGVVPVANILVKSLIGWPQREMMLPMAEHHVTGMAWSGKGHIKCVQISTDAGESWEDADLVGPRYEYSWQQWNFCWTPKVAGHYTLVARAQDEAGNWQPIETKWNALGYMINGVRPVCVTIEEPAS